MRSFETIQRGNNSGETNAAQQVFTLSSEFEDFWQSHSSIFSPPENMPEIDFDSDMVFTACLGTKNSGGYNIEIKSVVENDSEVIVECETTSPMGGIVTCALTQPFHMVKTPKSTKPVRFITTAKADASSEKLPLYICCVDESKKENVANQIEAFEAVEKVDKLFGGTIINIKFKDHTIEKNAARRLLEDVDGITSVEEDRAF